MSPDAVKAARAACAMTQAEFAAALGSDIRTIQRWEAGERRPRGAAIKLIETVSSKIQRRKRR